MPDDKIASLYYRFEQSDGRGFGILRLDAIGSDRATVIDADLSEADVDARIAKLRSEEQSV